MKHMMKRKKKKGGKWMRSAVKHPGAFTAQAMKAHMGVQAYAHKVLKKGSGASAKTRRRAQLAITFKKYGKR